MTKLRVTTPPFFSTQYLEGALVRTQALNLRLKVAMFNKKHSKRHSHEVK